MTDVIRRDAIATWLEALRPSTAIFCRAEVRAPWGFSVERRQSATFHILTQGAAVLEVDGVEQAVPLAAGDLVLLPTGAAHALRDGPTSAAPDLGAAVASGEVEGKRVSFGGSGVSATMVCGACVLGAPGSRMGASLPPLVRRRVEPALIDVVAREAEALASGREAVLKHLLTLLVVQALRDHAAEAGRDHVDAILAPEVARAISHIHRNLSDEIDVAGLCAMTGMSRTVLTERFRESLGLAPIEYLRLARLSRAAELLDDDRLGLERLARQVGYRSASTFSRAFRRHYGVAPGAYRDSRA